MTFTYQDVCFATDCYRYLVGRARGVPCTAVARFHEAPNDVSEHQIMQAAQATESDMQTQDVGWREYIGKAMVKKTRKSSKRKRAEADADM